MKQSLFSISVEFKALYDLANDITEDEDFEAIQALFNETESTLANKLENTVYVTKELDADAETLKTEAKRLNDKARALENRSKYLRTLMLGAIKASGQEKLKTDKFSFTIKHTEALQINSEDNIPREFIRIKREPMKTELKKFLKEGGLIEGLSIVKNESLGVR